MAAFAAILAAIFLHPALAHAQEGDHLSRGIEHYRAGRQTEALAELNAAVNADSVSPMAYYYAARIRLEQGEISRAIRNLDAALGDSADFADAKGLMAVILDREGDSKAADWWSDFIHIAGDDPAVPADSIMMPEEYRSRLAEAAEERQAAALSEQNRQVQAEATVDSPPPDTSPLSINNDDAAADGSGGEQRSSSAEESSAGGSDAVAESEAGSPPEGGEPVVDDTDIEGRLNDLDSRIRSGIRRGIYSIVSAAMLILCGVAGIALFMRHRRRLREASLGFAEEIDNALRERVEEEAIAFELTGESAERAFAEQSQRMKKFEEEFDDPRRRAVEPESRDTTPPAPSPQTTEQESSHYPEMTPQPESEPAWEPLHESRESGSSGEGGDAERPPITEDVKALVTRMSREGWNVNDICRAADLTRTEVELIIAVRSRHTENVVLDYAREREEDADADRLYQAVRELAADGESEIGIARKLGISRSEAAMAIQVMQKWR